jgi:hypothetical protein
MRGVSPNLSPVAALRKTISYHCESEKNWDKMETGARGVPRLSTLTLNISPTASRSRDFQAELEEETSSMSNHSSESTGLAWPLSWFTIEPHRRQIGLLHFVFIPAFRHSHCELNESVSLRDLCVSVVRRKELIGLRRTVEGQ